MEMAAAVPPIIKSTEFAAISMNRCASDDDYALKNEYGVVCLEFDMTGNQRLPWGSRKKKEEKRN